MRFFVNFENIFKTDDLFQVTSGKKRFYTVKNYLALLQALDY